MAFNFQKFTDPSISYDAKITIRSSGQFGFNLGAINKFGLEDCGYVSLYFDPEQRVVGIELLAGDGEDAIPIQRGTTNTFVRAKPFLDCHDIDYQVSTRFRLSRDDETGFLVFRLDHPDTKTASDHGSGAEAAELDGAASGGP